VRGARASGGRMGARAMTVERAPFGIRVPGADLRGDAWIPERPAANAAIVVCHGFKGFKDWGFFPHVSERLADAVGTLVVSFNFEGSGVRESADAFDDLPAFARNTFTKELLDLEIILDGLAAGRLGELELPPATRFGLLGHSRGGATCILKASVRRQVRALATWASIASAERYGAYAERWESGLPVVIHNARTGQDMPLERPVLDDLRANGTRLDVLSAAAALSIPWAIVHGEDDESVPLTDAEALAAASGAGGRLVRIEGAGHTFGTGHPFEGSTPALERALEAAVEAFHEGLTEEAP